MLAYTVEHSGRTFFNPCLRIGTGSSLRVRYWNALDETSIVHWHGLKVDTNNDGHPHYAVNAGETYDYQFTVANRAGTYWYHPHPHHLAGKQAYLGLAGLSARRGRRRARARSARSISRSARPTSRCSFRTSASHEDGSLAYASGGTEHFHGHCGEHILVNLTPSPCLDCESRLYRFRLVNGSNARIYRFAFMRGERAGRIHTDRRGRRPARNGRSPVHEVFLAPSERADVLLDLRGCRASESA